MMLDMHPWSGLSDDVRLGVLTEWVTADLVDEVRGRPTGSSSARPQSTPSARQAGSAVPPAGWPPRYSSGACGFYTIGGDPAAVDRSVGNGAYPLADTLERLAGYNRCNGDAPVPWLDVDARTLTLAPGQSTRLRITLDATGVVNPGDLNADLVIHQNIPYDLGYLPVTLTVHK
jgi:hypothetical protein